MSTQNNRIPNPESRAWKEIRVISIRPSNHGSSVRAYADVRLETDIGSITLNGLAVIQQNGKPPWVAFPQKPGKNAGKYFPVAEVDGKLRELIIARVLDAYDELNRAKVSSGGAGAQGAGSVLTTLTSRDGEPQARPEEPQSAAGAGFKEWQTQTQT